MLGSWFVNHNNIYYTICDQITELWSLSCQTIQISWHLQLHVSVYDERAHIPICNKIVDCYAEQRFRSARSLPEWPQTVIDLLLGDNFIWICRFSCEPKDDEIIPAKDWNFSSSIYLCSGGENFTKETCNLCERKLAINVVSAWDQWD